MSDEKKVSVDSILKNALQWKQWMADDLRILLNVSRNDNLSDKALHRLITHHLKTYTLVNQSFGYMIDSPETELFELPNLDYLKEILPSLDLTDSNVEKVIEPMLELELDGLSRELRDETLKPKEAVELLHDEDESEDVVDDEYNLDLHDEHDSTDDVLEYEYEYDDVVDDVVDTQEIEMDNELITSDIEQDDDIYVEDEVHELDVDDDIDDIEEDDEDDLPIPKIVDIPESKVETKDLIGELWDNMVMGDEKLGLNKGDANIGDGN